MNKRHQNYFDEMREIVAELKGVGIQNRYGNWPKCNPPVATMTEIWEIHGKGYYAEVKDPKKIIEKIKEGMEKGDKVTVNGHQVRIIQRDGKDAWEYIPGL